MTRPLTLTAIAERLGVTLLAAVQWRTRYAGTDRAFPEPDSPDGVTAYWSPDRWPEFEQWYAQHRATPSRKRGRVADADYVTQDDIGRWLGRTGGWIRLLRHDPNSGKVFTPCPVPFPEPDRIVRERNRDIPLWRRERLDAGEFEDWFRALLRGQAETQITAMEIHVQRMKAAQRAHTEAGDRRAGSHSTTPEIR